MSKLKLPEPDPEALERLRHDAERLGLRAHGNISLTPKPASGRGETARAIRGRQQRTAYRESAELIREDRDRS
jgi:hypothetical protein